MPIRSPANGRVDDQTEHDETSGDARAVTGDGSSRAACLVPLLKTTESPVGRWQYTPRWVYRRLMASSSAPILIALIDDYDIVLTGIARMLDPYRNRILVAEIDANKPLEDTVDIALYDSFAQPESDHNHVDVLLRSAHAKRVVIYTWNFHPDLIANARRHGVHGYLSKTLPARELVEALEEVHAGHVVISDPPPRPRPTVGLDWPGRHEGLTDREAEILALITQGKSNAEVAATTFLSPNTVKSYIRTIYRKIDVTSRTQAVLWGVRNGFTADHHRIDHWRGGP
jgi:DNA-binding NarL/FixJ family response regulator